jgi:hypothetical protein
MVCGLYSFSVQSALGYYSDYVNPNPTLESFMSVGSVAENYSVKNYIDWGTQEDWINYCSSFGTYFVDIDGVLVENGGGYSRPFWGTTSGIVENIRRINELYRADNKIILVTARPESSRYTTTSQLAANGVLYHQLVMDCGHCKRVIVNDFSTTNPYPSCEAISIARNSRFNSMI